MACKLTPQELDELETIFKQDPAAFADALSLKMNPRWDGKLLELWRGGLLTSPATHVANFSSNALFQVIREAERALSIGMQAGLERVGAMPKGQRDRFVGEMSASVVGAREALPDATARLFKGVKDALLLRPEIIDEADLRDRGIGGLHVGKVGPGEAFGIKSPVHVGRLARASFRMLETSDAFFKDIIGNQELHRQAYRRAAMGAKSEAAMGAKSEAELGSRYQDLLAAVRDTQNTSEHVEGIRKEMVRARLEDTFQDKLPGVFQNVAQTINRNPMLGFLAPFTRTPVNVTKQALLRTPIVAAYKTVRAFAEYKAGKAGLGRVTDEAARGALGLAATAAVLMLVEKNLPEPGQGGVAITGGGPGDYKQRQNLEQTGWRPYSIRVGDTYVSYKRVAPLSQIIGMAADAGEAADPEQRKHLTEKLFAAVAENVTNQTFLAGLQDLALAWRDPNRYLKTWVKQMEGSVVPGGVRAVAGAVDPVQRVSDPYTTTAGVPQPIVAGIPFASSLLPARRTATGEEAEKTASGLNPFTTSTLSADADLEREFARIGFVPGQPSRKVTVPRTGGAKVELTDDEYSDLQDAEQKAAERARKLMAIPTYQRAPDTDDEAVGTGRKSKAKLLSEVFSVARHNALAKMQRDIRRRWMSERTASNAVGQ
jgi:hypothetical protein